MDYKQYKLESASDLFSGKMELEAYLKQNKVWYKLTEKKNTIHTKDAAIHAGVDLERLTKSLVFLADNKPVMVIVPGNCRVDIEKLFVILKTKNIKLVPFEKAKEYSGYEHGATPPINHKNVAQTIIEKTLLKYETIYGGGGSRGRLIELKPEDIIKLTDAEIANIVE